MKFEIITDSSANLTDSLIEKYDLKIISLSYFIGEEEYLSYKEGVKTDYSEFYARIRKKEEARTSLANYEECMRVLRPIAESGRDILYIGFSSALSGTFQNVSNCMQELRTKHPDQKLFAFSLASILGGAVGNVVDRLLHGYVVDFLDFHWSFLSGMFHGGHFPAFNIADSAITLGAAFLILDELLRVTSLLRPAAFS